MSFLYFFDLVSFDKDGKVCESKIYDKNHAYSNYLYLVSKYNAYFVKEEGVSLPDFFKTELSTVLKDVEDGKSFEDAKKTVIKNCLPKVQLLAKNSANEREFVENLNCVVPIRDKDFAGSVKEVENDKHLAFILTGLSGKLFEKISNKVADSEVMQDKKEKSKVFKDTIKYNSLVETANKIQEHSITKSDIERLVG